MTNGVQLPINLQQALPLTRGYEIEPNFSQWQLDPKDVLELIEHALRGEIWKADPSGKGGKWDKPKDVKAMLNERGIQSILKKLTMVVNRVAIMSNLDEKTINSWLWDIGHDLAGELVQRMWPINDWEIDSRNLDPIHDLVMLFTEVSLKRALLDGERRKLYEAQKFTEQVTVDRSREGGGLLSFLPGFGGRKD